MSVEDAGRIGEIDRSEQVTLGYAVRNGKLRAEAVDWHVPPWDANGHGPHSVGRLVEGVRRVLDGGGVAFGAFDGEPLVGCAAVRLCLTPGRAQLTALWVSRGCRRQGIASRFLDEVVRVAKESGASELYVSATPSESAVGFYTSRGFGLAPPEKVNAGLLAEEPEDIQMTRPL
jgi:ribosomal protein S18 acetylase RimI-like enzyme